jgi:putative hemolysin
MDPSHAPLLIVLALLLVCSAVASASETALFGLSRARRAQLAIEQPRLGAIVDRLLRSPRRLLLQVLLLNMATNVAYFIVSSVLTLRAEGAAWRAGISVGSVLAIILFGEVFAKLFAVWAPTGSLRVLAPLQLVLRQPLRPIIVVLERWCIEPLTRLVVAGQPEAPKVTVSEMGTLLEMGASEGVIDEREQDLLGAIVMLSQRRVEEIMTPRVDFAWLDAEAPRERVLEVCAQTGLTRFPVFDGGLDGSVLGVVDAKRVLSGERIRDAIEGVHFVPETATLDALLEQFRKSNRSLALCVNEYGTVVGLVTLADLAEQLVSGISADAPSTAHEIELVGIGRWIVPGRLGVREWSAFFEGASAETFRARTLAGLIMHELGRLPRVGDVVALHGVRLEVREMEGRSVSQVEVRLELGDEGEAGGGA